MFIFVASILFSLILCVAFRPMNKVWKWVYLIFTFCAVNAVGIWNATDGWGEPILVRSVEAYPLSYATEIEGVAGTVSNMTKELMSRMGMSRRAKGVKVVIDGNIVTVDLALVMKYGYNIPITSKQVQERVKSAIENMTGLRVSNVGIRIVGVDMTTEE